MRPRFIEFRQCRLEDDFTRELHLTGIVDSGGNYAKVLAILAAIRDPPNGMVEGIDRVQPQLQLYRFRHWELPEECSVQVLVGLGTQRVSRGVPERILSRRNKGSGINPLAPRLIVRFGITYLIRAFVTAEE